MGNTGEEKKQDVLDQLSGLLRERWPEQGRAQLQHFLHRVYERAAPDDLEWRSLEDLYGGAVSLWKLLEQHHAGHPRVHVFNPLPEQHGWESTHTVVQIVTDDMPFLVDSVAMALNRLNLTIHLIIHPVVRVERDAKGRFEALLGEDAEAGADESCMHFEVDQQTEAEALQEIEQELLGVLTDVHCAVSDWSAMREQLGAVQEQLQACPPPVDRAEREEASAFLDWLQGDHFTFLGYRRYELVERDGEEVLQWQTGSGLGILRRPDKGLISQSFAALPPDVRRQALGPEPLILTKSNSRSTVHRPGYMDYVGVKRFDEQGRVIGEHRFLGLYTSAAYNRNPRSIPLLRRKLDRVLERAALPPRSHAGKALLNILETYPRDELIQISADELHRIALGILHLQDRQQVRLFVREDPFRRFVSCLVYAPRERYNTEVRQRMQGILQRAFAGEQSEFSVQLAESVLARIHFIIRLGERGLPEVDLRALERELAATTRSWSDDLHRALLEYYGEEQGNQLYGRYGRAFTAAYKEDTSPRAAAHDLQRLERLDRDNPLFIALYHPLEARPEELRFKLFHHGEPVTLSAALPVLENMGVEVIDERPYEVSPSGREHRWIHDFGLRYPGLAEIDIEQIREVFQEAFAAVWRRQAEDDGFQRLVLGARLSWREIVILRAYSKYLRQAGTPFSQSYFENTLASHPRIARLLVRLFHNRLDPERIDERHAEQLATQIDTALRDVTSLDEDRILRRFLAAIQATLRTNFFQHRDGRPKDYVSIKLSPGEIPGVPKPHPAYEIFVYSPRFEAVHLRGGKVARGGIRWSDRPEDFRTEVLGLMKAQMVKNAVIVPVGAKGGFVVKRAPEEREARMEEVKSCYRDFIRGMLDITDNTVENRTVPPADTVRHDEDDPYLVVAADKGTASFSDMANEVAAEYDFWLRDAFASGGSSGYDHKAMGITARGAWEAVKRHFRELGKDIQSEPFTVVGIGDMSGDVFGNGMLLSRQIRLLAAFDHRHIFIDPDPDPQRSWQERQRLFEQARSTWEEYDPALISEGGGVYSRQAKSIELSEQARTALGIDAASLTPDELIHQILQAPVDLLWNGGIGTYIKASSESNLDVGDKANDSVRVDGDALRAKVVGEGGNLGVTQLGRIEYALNGGRINTDAIDNAGGVDTSDHEVNIKILLHRLVDDGDLTLKQRNQLLAGMTDEVAALVLQNNYRQTQALSLSLCEAAELLDEQNGLMRQLEREALLDRHLEALPSEETVAERVQGGRGLTRPEAAVLLAYSKIYHYSQLLGSELMDEPLIETELLDYFPQALRERYPDAIRRHRLRQAITATETTNHIVNRMGSTFIYRVQEKSGASTADVARAYMAGRDIFGIKPLRDGVDALDNQVHADIQLELLLDINRLQERATHWLLANLPSPLPVQEAVEGFRPAVEALQDELVGLLPEVDREHLEQEQRRLVEAGVPEELAHRIRRLEVLYTVLDMAKICRERGTSLEDAARVYFETSEQLGLGWLREAITDYEAASSWEERARRGLEDEFYVQLRLLVARILVESQRVPGGREALIDWVSERIPKARRLAQTLNELSNAAQVDIAMLSVALQDLNNVVHAAAPLPPAGPR